MNRLLPGLALAACWLLLLLQGSVAFFALVIVLVLLLGGHEYGKMALSAESMWAPISLAVLIVLPALCYFLFPEAGISSGLMLAFLILSFWTLGGYRSGFDSYGFFSRGALGLLWIGFFGGHLLLIREVPNGNLWLLILSGITAGSDSGAYYTGRAFGRHKLSPLISPNKTVEGAIGGIVVGTFVASCLSWILLDSVPWGFVIFSAVLLACVGICGDLLESVIKRATGTKDSGTILGGHGGILDRADSILFAAPVLYYLLSLRPYYL